MKRRAFLAATWLCLGCRATAGGEPKPEASHLAKAAAPANPNAALDKLDQRRPVPLLPVMALHQKQNMRDHLEAVEQVVAAASAGDFDKVAAAATRMGYSES